MVRTLTGDPPPADRPPDSGTPLCLVDAIGPFFCGYDAHRVNWSKIPFQHLERNGQLDPNRFARVRTEFEQFAETVAGIGFTAITLDDIAHLTPFPAYPDALNERIGQYRAAYKTLFAIAASHKLQVYLTSDILFFNQWLDAALGNSTSRQITFFEQTLDRLFTDFTEISGVILRIGEADGLDVAGDFRSRLTIRTPAQARRWLRRLLPICECHNRTLIFRTWSVGAYPIGDLIWNRNTFRSVFNGLQSNHLVISMKYGETDFFRYLPLNKQFFRGGHRKIVEFQARREYEGFGEYPSYIGHDYEAYWKRLRTADNVVGAQVWCQTGGWSVFRRRTFLDPSSVWSEINTFVTLRIVRDGLSSDDALRAWWAWRRGPDAAGAETLIEMMRLSDEVIKELLYIDDFATRKLYFRRLRVPPLLSVYWDHILINHAMRKILRGFVEDGERSIRQGEVALRKIEAMWELAEALDLPSDDIQFQYDTFEILAAAREYYFRPFTGDEAARCQALAAAYRRRYPRRYSVHPDFTRVRIRKSQLRLLWRLLLRRQRGYRWVDRVFTIHALAVLHPILRRTQKWFVPAFVRDRAMGFDTVLR